MQKFTVHTGVAVPLDSANIDTDQIIPKQFLLAVDRNGFGKHLFHDWRYLDDAETKDNPEFNLRTRVLLSLLLVTTLVTALLVSTHHGL